MTASLGILDRGPEGAIAAMMEERFADQDAATMRRLDELIASGQGNLDRARENGIDEIRENGIDEIREYKLTGPPCRCGCGLPTRKNSKTGYSAYCSNRPKQARTDARAAHQGAFPAPSVPASPAHEIAPQNEHQAPSAPPAPTDQEETMPKGKRAEPCPKCGSFATCCACKRSGKPKPEAKPAAVAKLPSKPKPARRAAPDRDLAALALDDLLELERAVGAEKARRIAEARQTIDQLTGAQEDAA